MNRSGRLSERDLDGLSIEVKQAVRYLRADMRDDWYPDPLRWDGLLNQDHLLGSFLRRRFFRRYCEHEPSGVLVRDVPKANGTVRYSLEQTLADRFVYQLLAAELASDLDQLISVRVLSHRVLPRDSEKRRKVLFKSGVDQWRQYERLTHDDSQGMFVVVADVQTFYESISCAQVQDALTRAIADAPVSESRRERLRRFSTVLCSCLEKWAYNDRKGLPQNRDASSFLANLVMRVVDQEMIEAGHDYYRYMDDICIRCETHSSAREALVQLCRSLRAVGLSLNSKKTEIFPPGSDWHLKSEDDTSRRMRDIENMMRSRSVHLIARAVPYLETLLHDLLSKGEIDTRPFRFCAGRLIRVLRCEDIDLSIARRSELVGLAIEALKQASHASDYLCRLISALGPSRAELSQLEDLLLDPGEYLHEWQVFLVMRLLMRHDGLSERLLRACRGSLNEVDPVIPRDMAFLALGARGEATDRRRIADLVGQGLESHVAQRAALIALHEMDFERELKRRLKKGVHPHLLGTLKIHRRQCHGTYLVPAPVVKLNEIANGGQAYVG